jgi:hypothetical protein
MLIIRISFTNRRAGSASPRLPRDHAGRLAAKRVVAAHRKAHIGEPDRPQAHRRLGQNRDHLFDIGLNAPGRPQPHKQRPAIVRDMLRLVDQFPQRCAVYAAQGNNRSTGRAKDELRCLPGQQGLLRYHSDGARVSNPRSS